MIKVENLASFDDTVQRWFAAVEEAAAEAAVGLANQAFEQILETSPQYSGDFVANWKVSAGSAKASFTVDALGAGFGARYQLGDTPAMTYARSHAVWPKIKLGESIYLHNSAAHDEPYAWKIENGAINLRPVNEGADHVVRRAAAVVAFLFHSIGPVQLDGLRKFGV